MKISNRSLTFLLLTVCVFITWGCSGPAGSGNATSGVIVPPEDHSLTDDEYAELELPAYDQQWTGEEMKKASEVLTGIFEETPDHLPRYESENSGKTFARITAEENLEHYRDTSLPMEERNADALEYMMSGNQILHLYLKSINQKGAGTRELVELMGSQLRTMVVMIQLMDELQPTLDKEDPTYETRMKGLEQMKDGMATVVEGSVQTLSETNTYPISDLKTFASYMTDTFPVILTSIPEEAQTETLASLRKLLDDPQLKELEPELTTLVSQAEAVVNSEEAP